VHRASTLRKQIDQTSQSLLYLKRGGRAHGRIHFIYNKAGGFVLFSRLSGRDRGGERIERDHVKYIYKIRVSACTIRREH